MLNQQTIDKLHAMKLHGLADAFRAQLETAQASQLGFEERFDITMGEEFEGAGAGFRWLTVGPRDQPDLQIILSSCDMGRSPEAAARGMYDRLRSETAHVVLPAEDPPLAEFLARRRAEGVRVNVNSLGEVVLGDVT